MKTKRNPIIGLFAVLALLTMSCSLTSRIFNRAEDPVPATAADSPTQVPTEEGEAPDPAGAEPAETAPAPAGVDQPYVFDEGGFEFVPLPDWEISCSIGIIQMKIPGADPEFGPAFLIMAGDNPDPMTTEEAFEKFRSESTAVQISDSQTVKVGGFPALQAGMTSQQGDQVVRALVVTSMLTSYRQFTMMASAPEERWQEIEPHFDRVLKSMRFITPVPNAGCPGGETAGELPPTAAVEEQQPAAGAALLRQWAVDAVASSEYGDDSWSASQATGEPDANECGDSVYAWAPLEPDSVEWLELTYATPVYPTAISIYMNDNPSQVYEVQIIDVNGDAYTVVETEPEYVEYCPDVYEITLDLTKPIQVNRVRILIDQSILGLGWAEIDAVELAGTPQYGQINPRPAATSPASGSSESPYQPGDLDPGAYTYAVSGYENEVVMGANVQYQSTDSSYVVGLISGTERYIVSLILPRKSLRQGLTQLIPYEQSAGSNTPTAAIYINAFLYIADSGQIDIQSDPVTGMLTGTFTFKAHSKDFPDRSIEVSGAVNAVPLR